MNSRSRRHGEAKSQSEATAARSTSQIRSTLPAFLGAIAVVGAGLWFTGLLPLGGGGEHRTTAPASVSQTAPEREQALPQFVTAAVPRAREAYAFAVARGADLAYIPCYCGCGGHSGHRNVRDCFIKQVTASGVDYEQHGSTCDVCVAIVLDVKKMTGEGQSLAATRSYIDAKYSKIGPGTNTPLPPGMEALQ